MSFLIENFQKKETSPQFENNEIESKEMKGNRCITCFEDMGDENGRQYCGKTSCSNLKKQNSNLWTFFPQFLPSSIFWIEYNKNNKCWNVALEKDSDQKSNFYLKVENSKSTEVENVCFAIYTNHLQCTRKTKQENLVAS
jgi:hypothetical protein